MSNNSQKQQQKKTKVREVINIEQFNLNRFANNNLRQKFISQLAKQCNFLFQNAGHPSLYQKMMIRTEEDIGSGITSNMGKIEEKEQIRMKDQAKQKQQKYSSERQYQIVQSEGRPIKSQFIPFWQRIWKNQMIEKAALLFPQLNQQQLQKLIDRDWRIMRQQTKQKLSERYMNKNQKTLQYEILSFEQQLNLQMSKTKSKNEY